MKAFLGAAFKAHGREFVEEEYPAGLWNCEEYLGLSLEQFWKPLDSHAFWAGLEVTDDAHEILAETFNFFGEDNVCLLTSPSMSVWAGSGKMEWIASHLPATYQSGRFLIGRAKHFVAYKGAVLIDDNDKNCANFVAHGGTSILVPRRWNLAHEQANIAVDIVRAGLEVYLGGRR